MYIARRLVRMAIEDIGLADPRALEQASPACRPCIFSGSRKATWPWRKPAIYLAVAPKSDAAYQALNRANAAIDSTRTEPVPLHLRNAPTALMKDFGYSAGYQHAHKNAGGVTAMDCLPELLSQFVFYEPVERGFEGAVRTAALVEKSKRGIKIRRI